MNLHLNHVKCIIIICLLLACFCFNVYAQSSTTIGEDTFITTIHDENNNTVSLYLPESMNNDQSLRRIYGTPGGVIGMFETLYSQDRRCESYEAAIRELCLQPGTYDENNYITVLKEELDEAGATAEEAKIVLDLVKYGADSIKKNYIKGGTLPRDLRNKIANVGRKLNAIKKDSAFAKACDVIGGISADIEATKQLTDIITGSLLLNSLATDNALLRLEEIERVIESEGKVDKALKDALTQSRINILASQDDIGAFAVYVNDHIRDITDSAMSLGAPLMTYNTLKGISNQWEMAQDAVTLATLTKMIEENSEDHEDITDNLTSYGQYAFYLKLEETFDVGMAKFHDFINIVGSANRDWAQYYRQKKEITTIIAMEIDNFQEESSNYSDEKIAITSVINNFIDVLNNRNWVQAKQYCVTGSQADLNVNDIKDTLENYFNSNIKVNIEFIINNIDVCNINAEAYCTQKNVINRTGEIIQENADGIIFLEKIDNKWKIYEIKPQ